MRSSARVLPDADLPVGGAGAGRASGLSRRRLGVVLGPFGTSSVVHAYRWSTSSFIRPLT